MTAILIAMLLAQLNEKYPSADSCWDVLEIDLVEFEEQATFELDWCLNRYASYYDRKPGDDPRSPYWTCREARMYATSKHLARQKAEEVGAGVDFKSVQQTAKQHLVGDRCRQTRGEHLWERFEEERAKQIATLDCWNAEQEINYGPLGMGPYRKHEVDLNCWLSGWRKFYVDPHEEAKAQRKSKSAKGTR